MLNNEGWNDKTQTKRDPVLMGKAYVERSFTNHLDYIRKRRCILCHCAPIHRFATYVD